MFLRKHVDIFSLKPALLEIWEATVYKNKKKCFHTTNYLPCDHVLDR